MKIRIKNKIYHPAQSRQDELWEMAASLAEQLQKTAELEVGHLSKVEAARDQYLELRQILRELAVW